MLKVVGWAMGATAIYLVAMFFDKGEILAGLICLFAAGFLIPPMLNKINNNARKKAEEEGKEHKDLSLKGSIIGGVLLLVLAGFVGSEDQPKTAAELVAASNERTIEAQKKAAKEKAQKENTTKPKKWYTHTIKLSFGEMTGKEWNSYSDNERIALSANILATFWNNKTLTPAIMINITEIDDLKPYAKELTIALNTFYNGESSEVTTNQTVAESAVVLLTLMEWIA